ncbi:chemotaxis protein CheW [Methylocystis sp. WRRC1]|uniref:chemotaxis protein CheW n=1 Tax=unclassified Methylocystis TaxID=2625913 RepID=UPI0001F87384|nr:MULTISPECIES: chemotaxis protein CheW [unclassified Methylocystis]MCC3244859.1 chemotaxis protein CheW [Methylocystis sp. WRRC1]
MRAATAQTQGSDPQEFIAFHVGSQTYCIDIMAVREIRGWTPATPLPHAPGYVRGVINLRGAVLPVIDLAARLALPIKEPTARHAVIVVQNESQVVGLLVEAVSNIMMVSPDAIQPTPEVASELSRSFIKGIVAAESEVISVLVIKNLLPETLAGIQ